MATAKTAKASPRAQLPCTKPWSVGPINRLANISNHGFALLLSLLALLIAAEARCESGWTLSPYRVQVQLAVQTQSMGSAEFAAQVQSYLAERVDSSIGALWDLSFEQLARSTHAQTLHTVLQDRAASLAITPNPSLDKTFVIAVQETALGIEAGVVEFDHQLARWSSLNKSEPPMLDQVCESLFRQMVDTFAPLAQFRVAKQVGGSVELIFRGSELPQRPGGPDWIRQDDLMLPVLRQLDREGLVSADNVRRVPWTYLQLETLGEPTLAKFVSHTRRPLPSRRRGRVDYLAIRLPRTSATTTLKLHAKQDAARPLVGYQVYLQDGQGAQRELAGVTNADGKLAISPGEARILMAYIKCGSQLVAKAPIVPGAEQEVVIPLLDESTRLEAEAKLGILRESLIDLVAQRQILIARINAAIEEEAFDAATKLVDDLERLPARALFDRRLRMLEQSSVADKPIVQKRIDRLFDDTRTVLATFLSPREIMAVKMRLAEAKR